MYTNAYDCPVKSSFYLLSMIFFLFARNKNIFGKDWLKENRDFRGTDLEWNRVQFFREKIF